MRGLAIWSVRWRMPDQMAHAPMVVRADGVRADGSAGRW